jgi:DNA-binding XRE family transcriptional regulator
MPDLQTYERSGGMVHVPEGDFLEIARKLDFLEEQERLEDEEAAAAVAWDLANPQEYLPEDVALRIINGENPLRVYREYRGLTQVELGARAGRTGATVSEIETGRKRGSITTLRALARALDVDVDDLLPPA